MELQSSNLTNAHTIAALIGFLPELQAAQLLLTENLVDAPRSLGAIHKFWEQTQKNTSQLQSRNWSTSVDRLPARFQSWEAELRSRDTFIQFYEGIAEYRICLIPTEQLIVPQWQANLDYIEVLRQKAPAPGNLADGLPFAFEERAEIESPCFSGGGYTFRSPSPPNLFAMLPPEVRSSNPHEFEVVTRVRAKGNYLQAAKINGHYVIINGVHRSAALLRAGWDRIPCLLRDASTLFGVGMFSPQDGGGMIPEQILVKSNRPPYLADLFDATIAPQFHQRNMETILRITPQVELQVVHKA